MAARLKGDVNGRATRCIAGHLEGVNFSVRLAGTSRPAFANNYSVAHNNATDTRIRGRRQAAKVGQMQRSRHLFVVDGAEHIAVNGGARLRG